MASLAEQAMAELPKAVDSLVAFLSAPKGFLLRLSLEDDGAMTSALAFFALFSAANFFLALPYQPPHSDPSSFAAKYVAFLGLGTIFFAAEISIAWRAVGGRTPFRTYLLFTFYISAIATLLSSFGSLVSRGVVKVFAPTEIDEFSTVINNLLVFNYTSLDKYVFTDSNTGVLLVGLGIFWVLSFIVVGWLTVCWGAFRQVNTLSRWRSAMAFALWFLLNLLLGVPLAFVGRALDFSLG